MNKGKVTLKNLLKFENNQKTLLNTNTTLKR